MKVVKTICELLCYINSFSDVYLYGAGNISNLILDEICEQGILSRICGIYVSELENEQYIRGIEVRKFCKETVSLQNRIVIAVSSRFLFEVVSTVSDYKVFELVILSEDFEELLQESKRIRKYQKYFDELMNTHDLRMKYTEEFLAKGTKVSSADEALGIKAVDYIALAPKVDANQAYQWLSQSVNAVKGESAAATLFYFLQMSLDKLKADPNHKEQFIQDYLLASEYADAAIAAETNEAKKKNFMGIKDNLVALFVNSGTADCESLQSIYGPKVEANQTDLAYLKKVIDIMKMMRCTESEAYLQASFYAYKIEPTAEAATGCAYQAFKKGDIDGAVKFFDEAIQLETDNVKKAEKAYAAAAVLASAKKLSQARSYCQKAISFNENYGAPYILIANLYAMSPNWSDESALNKCTYFAVIDKLQRAKAVDPSVAEEANKLIGTYSGHTPQAKDLFMLGYKQGDRITIGGWIGETTTIR